MGEVAHKTINHKSQTTKPQTANNKAINDTALKPRTYGKAKRPTPKPSAQASNETEPNRNP
ncbi:MAG: hypothetical protein U1C56_01320 [Candidatus Curtissbacteria bacterium]|nr:hypothetical protein [Candidatus Curtissbacteria bacterium]